jgi:hypothetical protein
MLMKKCTISSGTQKRSRKKQRKEIVAKYGNGKENTEGKARGIKDSEERVESKQGKDRS